MKIEEIQKHVDTLKALADDFESLHYYEDKLRNNFLKYIANGGTEDLQAKARLILSTNKIADGDRWYS